MKTLTLMVHTDSETVPIEELLESILFRHCRRRQIATIMERWDGSIDSLPKDHRVVIYTDGEFPIDPAIAEFCFWNSHVWIHDMHLVLRNGELLFGPEAEHDVRQLLAAA